MLFLPMPSNSEPLTHSFRQALFHRTIGICAAVAVVFLASCSRAEAGGNASFEVRLAEHLQTTGARMYGAFWCPHCAHQKELFGEAVEQVPYVECDPAGENSQAQLCEEKEIQGYPTWEIDGEFYLGGRSLEDLARISGFLPAE